MLAASERPESPESIGWRIEPRSDGSNLGMATVMLLLQLAWPDLGLASLLIVMLSVPWLSDLCVSAERAPRTAARTAATVRGGNAQQARGHMKSGAASSTPKAHVRVVTTERAACPPRGEGSGTG